MLVRLGPSNTRAPPTRRLSPLITVAPWETQTAGPSQGYGQDDTTLTPPRCASASGGAWLGALGEGALRFDHPPGHTQLPAHLLSACR